MRGLVVDTAKLRRRWWWAAAAQAALAVGGLVLGVASGSWFVAAAVVVVALLGALPVMRSRQAAERTDAGHEAVRAAWADRSLVTGAAGAVVLGGLGAIPTARRGSSSAAAGKPGPITPSTTAAPAPAVDGFIRR
ncbi:hypothetical protein AB0F91_11120 [Amycolatopsis sp. NPDC023774]|uniref:hypothetical protein n=1 Tax=Amycolatopsis sp. NPDC023774 TaxID=3155015 RepID=UPI0033FC0FBA